MVSASKVKWVVGLVLAVVSAVAVYLTQGCTPAELSKVNQGAVVASTLCGYLETRTEPEYAKAKAACQRKAELQEVLRAAAECSAK